MNLIKTPRNPVKGESKDIRSPEEVAFAAKVAEAMHVDVKDVAVGGHEFPDGYKQYLIVYKDGSKSTRLWSTTPFHTGTSAVDDVVRFFRDWKDGKGESGSDVERYNRRWPEAQSDDDFE